MDFTLEVKILRMYLKEIEEEVDKLEQKENEIKIYIISQNIKERTEAFKRILEIIQTRFLLKKIKL